MIGDVVVERQQVGIFRLTKVRDEPVLFGDHLAPIGDGRPGLDALEPHRRRIGVVDALHGADNRLGRNATCIYACLASFSVSSTVSMWAFSSCFVCPPTTLP